MEGKASELANALFEAADDEKAQDIVLLHVGELTIICDHFLNCAGASLTHVKAIAEGILERLKEQGVVPLHQQFPRDAKWVALDYGSVVVHVFTREARAFYDLEGLWSKATVVRRSLEPEGAELR